MRGTRVMLIATPVSLPSRLGCPLRHARTSNRRSKLSARQTSTPKHRARFVPMSSKQLGTLDRGVVSDGVLHLHTPLLKSQPMSELIGKDVYIKLDALQPSGSFKLRGIGYTCQKAVHEGAKTFTSSSGGNAGLATAYAGQKLGIPTTVVVPETTPEFIRYRLRAFDAKVVVHGSQWSEANEEAIRINEKNNGKLVHPFDDADTWTGHATVVHEVLSDLKGSLGFKGEADTEEVSIGTFVTCVGGGGLLAGILQGLSEIGLEKETPVIAAETIGADSMFQSLHAGEVITLPGITSVAKSLGAASPSPVVFGMCKQKFGKGNGHLVRPTVVSDEDAIRACLKFADDHRVLVEPACGAALSVIYGRSDELIDVEGPIIVEVCGGAIVDRKMLDALAREFGIEEE